MAVCRLSSNLAFLGFTLKIWPTKFQILYWAYYRDCTGVGIDSLYKTLASTTRWISKMLVTASEKICMLLNPRIYL